jgi:hypothetical protein
MSTIGLPAVLWFFSVACLVTGIGLVALARWGQPLVAASAAAEAGRVDDALAGFVASEARFDTLATAKRILPRAYDATIANQLALLYRTDQYDELLEKAAAAPSTAATHFWAGCALFARGKDEEQSEARIAWLSRAEQEFRSALELEPADWNTKYNFELTRKLLEELRKQPKTPPKQLMQLLRPKPTPGGPPTKRVG